MASVTIQATSACASGGHVHLEVTGDRTQSLDSVVDDIRGPLSAAEFRSYIELSCRIVLAGKTRAEARAILQTGFNVVVGQ